MRKKVLAISILIFHFPWKLEGISKFHPIKGSILNSSTVWVIKRIEYEEWLKVHFSYTRRNRTRLILHFARNRIPWLQAVLKIQAQIGYATVNLAHIPLAPIETWAWDFYGPWSVNFFLVDNLSVQICVLLFDSIIINLMEHKINFTVSLIASSSKPCKSMYPEWPQSE